MLACFFLVNWCIFGLLWEVFEGEFDGQFIFFSDEVWAALNKLLRGHEPWQPPSSHGIHVKKKAKMRHTWRYARLQNSSSFPRSAHRVFFLLMHRVFLGIFCAPPNSPSIFFFYRLFFFGASRLKNET